MQTIKEFQGEYRWLSNFMPCKIVLSNIIYPSVEHAYMSAKSIDPSWKELCARPDIKPGEIKRRSRKVKLVENWDSIKLQIMRVCLQQKYTQEPYLSKLIATKGMQLEEGNKWNDKFWGIDLRTGEGENNLGKMIMEIREQLLSK